MSMLRAYQTVIAASASGLMLLLALGATTSAAETFDIIFIIDGSNSVSSAPNGPFTLQKEGIANCLAGERAFIPHEGECAIAVIQVGKHPPGAPPETPDVTIEIPLTIIDSAATAQQKANQVLAITQGYGGTPLDDALEATRDILRNYAQGNAAFRRGLNRR